MPTSKAKYGTLTTIAITANTLAAGDARQSDKVQNLNRYLDLELLIGFTLAAGSPSDQSKVNLYLVPSPNGTNFPTPAGESDADITLDGGTPVEGHLVGFINTPDAGQAYTGHLRSVLQYDEALALAPWWVLVVENRTGVAFTAFSAKYLGKQIEIA